MNGCDPCMKKRQFKNYRMERTLYIVNSGINIVLFAFYNHAYSLHSCTFWVIHLLAVGVEHKLFSWRLKYFSSKAFNVARWYSDYSFSTILLNRFTSIYSSQCWNPALEVAEFVMPITSDNCSDRNQVSTHFRRSTVQQSSLSSSVFL